MRSLNTNDLELCAALASRHEAAAPSDDYATGQALSSLTSTEN